MVKSIHVGARASPLSLVQVQEVLRELRLSDPEISFTVTAMPTSGDLDRITSLRNLDKTDFFTKELDALLLNSGCRIAIHSAKDLPDPLPEGLKIVAITKGVDSSDSLVLRQGATLGSLPKNAVIATSSIRREENVQQLRSDLTFCDIRGTIAERLQVLEKGKVDGVVIAEAALIRLGLTHLNRVRLPGSTTPLQGQLAILARKDDIEMAALFTKLDTRGPKKTLYLGLEPSKETADSLFHFPVIEIFPIHSEICLAQNGLNKASHILFTSRTAVRLFFNNLQLPSLSDKIWIAVGKRTAQTLADYGITTVLTPKQETAEGVVALLETLDLSHAHLLWPHAAAARDVINSYLIDNSFSFAAYSIYTTSTRPYQFLPDLNQFEELHFTSPSTVQAFIDLFGGLPSNKRLTAIGPITQNALNARSLMIK